MQFAHDTAPSTASVLAHGRSSFHGFLGDQGRQSRTRHPACPYVTAHIEASHSGRLLAVLLTQQESNEGNWVKLIRIATIPLVDREVNRQQVVLGGHCRRLGSRLDPHAARAGGCGSAQPFRNAAAGVEARSRRAGISLSRGTAELAVREAEPAAAGRKRWAAVLGCGVMGLATARLLHLLGWRVTLYERDLPPRTTSNVAGGQWTQRRSSTVTWRRPRSSSSSRWRAGSPTATSGTRAARASVPRRRSCSACARC